PNDFTRVYTRSEDGLDSQTTSASVYLGRELGKINLEIVFYGLKNNPGIEITTRHIGMPSLIANSGVTDPSIPVSLPPC
ncbi:MAG: hypothetical protein AAFO02_21540, partial [Bacteroidota bacterium]